ncbi:MAG TPA: hypothetical protein VFZ26_18845 [Gemmatimonadales bacterium]
MPHTPLLGAAAVVLLAACGGSSERTSAATAAERCDILTAADVQAVTGVAVTRIDRNAAMGAGGTCVNFASPDGRAYLGVNRLESQGEFTASVEAVPSDVYPDRSPVAGLGDEAVLFEGPGGLRYLVARKGEAGIVLFPLGEGFEMTDDQLRELASRALAAAA